MMIVIPQGYETAAADATSSAEAVTRMMEYNKSLQKAGVLLGLDGLHPRRPRGEVREIPYSSFDGGTPYPSRVKP